MTISLLTAKYPNTIGAWVAEMAFDVAEPIRESVLRETRSATLGYNDPVSIAAARESVARRMATCYGWDVTPSAVAFVSDVVSGFAATLRHFLPEGAAVVVPTPAYGPLLTVPHLTGHRVVTVPGKSGPHGHGLDFDGIERALAAGGLLVVLVNPHNPTGRVYTREELSRLEQLVDAHHARVFADEIHAPITLDGRPHLPYASLSEIAAAHTITATSASKAWNTSGLKCAQLIFSSPADVRTWDKVADFYVRSVSRLGVAALLTAYEDLEAQKWLDETLSRLRHNKATVYSAVNNGMPSVVHHPVEATYLAWLDCRALHLDEPATYFREHAGVALTDGSEFGEPGHVRLNFALPDARLDAALNGLARAVTRLRA
ncbi:aminotransferase class I/II-fold pyridoxal phosphate-dependent enzyme [Streptomyces canus]|uniref:MalY/PatB family protein n=1 Tax=Streptomyces canus TaxID=58343 RepID=UPI00225628AE|nr:aminotransferase class I/II-fold pyridoxal phosphate-dependent enzyme [Streptomyces canus]MCX5256833.1 aminotransferase class I/II-fold pyridoxal phosphate-dependent enzyme [Streptomyces canus]